MLVNSVLMIVISVFDNSKQRFDSILMMVNSVLNSTCLPVQPNQPNPALALSSVHLNCSALTLVNTVI